MIRKLKFWGGSRAVCGHQPILDREEWTRSTAFLVGTGGDLYSYLPKRPGWCRTIGDDVCATLGRGEPVTLLDSERLGATHITAQLNRTDTDPELNWNPTLRKQRWVYLF